MSRWRRWCYVTSMRGLLAPRDQGQNCEPTNRAESPLSSPFKVSGTLTIHNVKKCRRTIHWTFTGETPSKTEVTGRLSLDSRNALKVKEKCDAKTVSRNWILILPGVRNMIAYLLREQYNELIRRWINRKWRVHHCWSSFQCDLGKVFPRSGHRMNTRLRYKQQWLPVLCASYLTSGLHPG